MSQSIVHAATAGEKKYALIVGNDLYEGGFNPLPTCVNDAKEMDRCLTALGYKTTLLTNATRAELIDAVHKMQDVLAGENAIGVFFYSGHAVAIGGESYLVPARTKVSTDNSTFREDCLSVGSISKLFKTKCSRSLLFLDACRDIVHTDTKGGWSPSRNVVKGSGNEQVICYATAYGKVARAGKDGLSPFTKVLTAHLFDPESFMAVWLHKVEDEVESISGQTPVLEGGFSSDFYFNEIGTIHTVISKSSPYNLTPSEIAEFDKALSEFIDSTLTSQSREYDVNALIAQGRTLDNSSATIAQAIDMYQQAAQQGSVEAMYLLGKAYTFGNKATKDKAKAKIWLDKAQTSGVRPWCDMAASLKRQLSL